ncbi:MAG TPA: glycosyltransferase family 39 protein, partial [Flavobacteriales bacterium]
MAALSTTRIQWLIAAVALLFFVPGLGAVHLFDWDEINFAEIAREMLVTGDWLQPKMAYEPFHEKPPLFIWLQALSMSVFGAGEFAARLPNAICGVLTLVVLFRIGDRLQGRTFGLLWCLAYFGSILPHLYFRSGIIDPWFNLFIFLGVLSLIRASNTAANEGRTNKEKDRAALFTGLWLGLAVLTKGPVGLLVPGLCVTAYWALSRFRAVLRIRHLGLMAFTFILVPSLWFGIDLLRNGPTFLLAFFDRQMAMLSTEDAGHGGFFGYHFVVLLIGCFPASIFALQELLKPTRTDARSNDQRRWMAILFWVVLILFSIVRTKIVHYSSLCYFPLTYLAALRLQRLWNGERATMWPRVLLGAIGSLFALITSVLPFLGMDIDIVRPLTANDAFAGGNLEAEVHWTGLETLAGLCMVFVLFLGHRFFAKADHRKGIPVVFGGTAVFVLVTLYFFIGRIEGYSQRAAVEFFQGKADERCWPVSHGY